MYHNFLYIYIYIQIGSTLPDFKFNYEIELSCLCYVPFYDGCAQNMLKMQRINYLSIGMPTFK
jgi:hypothetical protein